MSVQTYYLAITAVAVVANTLASIVDFARAEWVLANMTRYGVPHRWLFLLGVAKAAGAVGLLAGVAVPLLGIAAAAGLSLYFVGAVVTVVRSRSYSHIAYPGAYLALSVSALVLRLVTS
ncbi:DoxX family protein [Lentzea sp. NPDC058450]|uniref:DoxX family protein n=1 Tax=Lentzea sp. NPDC058450 TaxID=3346505 RepID=UPI003652C093